MNGVGVTEVEFVMMLFGIMAAFNGYSFWNFKIFSLSINQILIYLLLIGNVLQMGPHLVETYKVNQNKTQFLMHLLPFVLITTSTLILGYVCPPN